MADLSVELCGVQLKNPIVAASGTFGFGREFEDYFDLSRLGGICVKGLTVRPRQGNPPPRIAETPGGMLNSVGLQNPGVDAFCEKEMPHLKKSGTVIIANISGNTPEEFRELAEKVTDAGVDLIEVNISCPNLHCGGAAFGMHADTTEAATAAAKAGAGVPVIVKLSPNVTDIVEIARAAEGAGADGLSLINTLLGMRIDTDTRRPILRNNTGGLSGPAVLPVAVRMVWQVASAVRLPILGMGGVKTGRDAAELMLAGAAAVGVGAENLTDPMACVRICEELEQYLDSHGVATARELTGGVIAY